MYLKSLKIELVLDMICPGPLNDAIRLLSIFNSASFRELVLSSNHIQSFSLRLGKMATGSPKLTVSYSTFTVKKGVFACFL